MPEPDRTVRFLNFEQIDKQLEVLQEHPQLQVMVATYIYAGLRRSELLWLTHDDVDIEEQMIYVRAKNVEGETWIVKTGRNRPIPISSDLQEWLTECDSERDSPWFFPSPQGVHWDPDNFSRSLRHLNQEAKLPWSCLDFRHTFGSILAANGESLYKISKLMGNSPEICRRHYAMLIPTEMRDTVEFGKPRKRKKGRPRLALASG